MARRAPGTVSRRLVTGVGELVLHHHRRLDTAFCMRPLGKSCRWCRNIADLEAGQPVQLPGDEIYTALCADEHLARTCRDLMHDESIYEVRADTLDLIAATLPSSGTRKVTWPIHTPPPPPGSEGHAEHVLRLGDGRPRVQLRGRGRVVLPPAPTDLPPALALLNTLRARVIRAGLATDN